MQTEYYFWVMFIILVVSVSIPVVTTTHVWDAIGGNKQAYALLASAFLMWSTAMVFTGIALWGNWDLNNIDRYWFTISAPVGIFLAYLFCQYGFYKDKVSWFYVFLIPVIVSAVIFSTEILTQTNERTYITTSTD